jgi:hypothetical protein
MTKKLPYSTKRAYIICALSPAIAVVAFISAPWWLFKYYQSTDKYKAKKQKKKETRNATPPKVKQRKRALSISEHLTKGQSVKDQYQSHLWKLPAELRLQIYQEVVGRRQLIHISCVAGDVESYRCQKTPDRPRNLCWAHHRFGSMTREHPQHTDHGRMNVLALLRSCRLM